MPYFEVKINDKKVLVFGGREYKYLEVGIISVGPKFDVDILCNAVRENETDSTTFLNKKINCGDIVTIVYSNSIDEDPVKNQILDVEERKNNLDITENGQEKSRKFLANIDDQCMITTSAADNFTLTFNCIWTSNNNKCSIIFGNTDYKGNEQWIQKDFGSDQKVNVEIR